MCIDDKAAARMVHKGGVEAMNFFVLKTHRADPQLQQARRGASFSAVPPPLILEPCPDLGFFALLPTARLQRIGAPL